MMVRHAKAAVANGWAGLDDEFATLPGHANDFQWDLLYDVLFQDLDILSLFDAELDGIEDPEAEQNRWLGIGDYTPQAWFAMFSNLDPRDPRRPFRR